MSCYVITNDNAKEIAQQIEDILDGEYYAMASITCCEGGGDQTLELETDLDLDQGSDVKVNSGPDVGISFSDQKNMHVFGAGTSVTFFGHEKITFSFSSEAGHKITKIFAIQDD